MNVPTREEHRRFIQKVWATCIAIATAVFVVTGGTVAALAVAGHPWALIVAVSTSIFQVLVMSYALAFFVPSFLTSLSKLSLGIEMSRQSLDLGTKTVDAIAEMKDEIKPVITDLRHIADRLEQSVVKDDVLGKVESHMKAIRERIERDTKPLESPQRRDRTTPPAPPEPATVSLDDIDRMEDALNAAHDDGIAGT